MDEQRASLRDENGTDHYAINITNCDVLDVRDRTITIKPEDGDAIKFVGNRYEGLKPHT